jgi:hypothetical protein
LKLLQWKRTVVFHSLSKQLEQLETTCIPIQDSLLASTVCKAIVKTNVQTLFVVFNWGGGVWVGWRSSGVNVCQIYRAYIKGKVPAYKAFWVDEV